MTNATDDDRAARMQVTLRLDRRLIDTLDSLAGEEGMDRTELVRRLLSEGLAEHQVRAALADVAAGRKSAWAAASRAGLDLYEMLDRVAEAGVPYRLDPEVLERLRGGKPDPPAPEPHRSQARPAGEDPEIGRLRSRYRPDSVRVLFVGESAPAGGTHFYLGNSNLFRATREAFGRGFGVAHPPDSAAFLDWFMELGCWLVDLADRPVNQLSSRERARVVEVGVPRLASILRETSSERVLVLVRRVAPAVRRAAALAGLDERAIDVLPFPIRQWRSTYVEQLAGIMRHVGAKSGASMPSPVAGESVEADAAAREVAAPYESVTLHDVVAQVLREHGGGWLKASQIAREIAERDLWRRPSDGEHPRGSQVSARVRQYPALFQSSDLGIRLRAQ